MSIAVRQEPSEYVASWWWSGLYDNPTSVAEWIESYNFCFHHGGRIYVMCNGGSCV